MPLAFLTKTVTSAYKSIFHSDVTPDVAGFLKSLGYVIPGMAVAYAALVTFDVLTGRFMGPDEYGKFALTQSIAMFLYIPMLLGFHTAMVKYMVEKSELERQRRIVSTTYILVAVLTITSSLLFSSFSFKIADAFSVQHTVFSLAIVFAIIFVLFTITTSLLQGLFKIGLLAICYVALAVILVTSLLCFLKGGFSSFQYAVLSICLAYGVPTVSLTILLFRRYFRLVFDRQWATTLTKYSLLAVVGTLTFVLYTNIDKIVINRYMGTADVGIYRAYSAGSISIAMALFAMFNAVFFPTASKYEKKGAIFERLNKLMPYFGGLGVPMTVLCVFILLKFYGAEYPFDLGLAILFGVAGVVAFINGCYAWLMASVGQRGIMVTTSGALICALTNVVLNILLIPLMGLVGAVISTIVSYILYTCLLFMKRKLIQGE